MAHRRQPFIRWPIHFRRLAPHLQRQNNRHESRHGSDDHRLDLRRTLNRHRKQNDLIDEKIDDRIVGDVTQPIRTAVIRTMATMTWIVIIVHVICRRKKSIVVVRRVIVNVIEAALNRLRKNKAAIDGADKKMTTMILLMSMTMNRNRVTGRIVVIIIDLLRLLRMINRIELRLENEVIAVNDQDRGLRESESTLLRRPIITTGISNSRVRIIFVLKFPKTDRESERQTEMTAAKTIYR